jgi:hypothetical protein
MAEDRPGPGDASEPDLQFENVERLGRDGPPESPPPADELFHPTEHTERADPGLCRNLVIASAALSVPGICLPSCLAVPMILVGGVLAVVAYSLRERRYSHIAIGLAIAALLLHGAVVVARGIFGGFGKGVVKPYERLLRDD